MRHRRFIQVALPVFVAFIGPQCLVAQSSDSAAAPNSENKSVSRRAQLLADRSFFSDRLVKELNDFQRTLGSMGASGDNSFACEELKKKEQFLFMEFKKKYGEPDKVSETDDLFQVGMGKYVTGTVYEYDSIRLVVPKKPGDPKVERVCLPLQ